MDTSQWPQEQIGLVNYIEGSSNNIPNSGTTCSTKPLIEVRRTKPQKDQILNCPRCNSTNTKFCYYNNYSLTQPRYFCKTCRRYWTEGGTLRNIPVGGVSRKNKRSSSSSSSSKVDSSSNKVFIHDHHMIINNNNPLLPNLSQFSSQNPKIALEEGQDLNLSFQAAAAAQDYDHHHGMITQFVEMPQIASRVLNSFIPMPVPPDSSNMLYSSSSGFPLHHEIKPSLGTFSSVEAGLRNGGHGFGNFHGISSGNNGNGMLLFPFGEVKPHSSSTTTSEVDHQNNKGQGNPTGYWNGMLGGGASW